MLIWFIGDYSLIVRKCFSVSSGTSFKTWGLSLAFSFEKQGWCFIFHKDYLWLCMKSRSPHAMLPSVPLVSLNEERSMPVCKNAQHSLPAKAMGSPISEYTKAKAWDNLAFRGRWRLPWFSPPRPLPVVGRRTVTAFHLHRQQNRERQLSHMTHQL